MPDASLHGTERVPGSIYYECSTRVSFMVPGPYGNPPVLKHPLKPERPAVRLTNATTAGPEFVEGTAVVETDGKITNLSMYWMQLGLLGWPETGRADLDDIVLYLRYGGYPRSTGLAQRAGVFDRFDPKYLAVEVRALETKKMKTPRLLTLSKSSGGGDLMGGLADIPPWLKSASIYTSWDELERFSQGQARLFFSIEEIVFRDDQFYHDHVRGGTLDLSVIPAVIAHFQEAEEQLKAKAGNRTSQCKEIEVQPEEHISDGAI
jgi:hypothetical protein